MSQHDMVIDNGPGLAVRTDINAAIQALVQQSSGPIEPTVKYPGQLWLDTTIAPDGLLRQRNQANNAWITPTVLPPTSGNMNQTIFTSSGTYTKPAGLRYLRVEGVGPGGGGAQSVTPAANQWAAASGAGAGAYGMRLFAASELAASTPYTIGAAGTGGAVTTGGTGGTSEFGSGLNCTLGGGVGATRSASVAVPTQVVGGVGGAPGSGWTIGVNGEIGRTSVAGIAGSLSLRGRGGVTRFGSAPSEDTYFGNAGGSSPVGYGGGAGGQVTYNSTAGSSAPAGGPAMFILTEYF